MKLTIFHIASLFFTIKLSYNGLSATFKVLVLRQDFAVFRRTPQLHRKYMRILICYLFSY